MGVSVLARLNYALGVFAVFAYAAAAAYALFKILFETNHIGFSLFDFLPRIAALALAGLSNTLFPLRGRMLGIAVLGLSALAFGCVFLFDKYNVLVEYNEWTRRGMPAKPWE